MNPLFQRARDWLQETTGIGPSLQSRLLATVVAIVVISLLQRLTLWVVARRVKGPQARYRLRKAAAYVTVPVALFVIGRIWFEGVGSIATVLGLASAGLAIALKDPLSNLAGWVFILWRRPFVVGDRIQVGPHAGDVVDVRLFQFTLFEIGEWVEGDQPTGRVLRVPNAKVLTETTANYTRGFRFIWNELPITLTFESDWQKAKRILAEIVERHAAHVAPKAAERVDQLTGFFLVHPTQLAPAVYTSVVASGVQLTIRYLCDPHARRATAEAIWEEVLTRFAAERDIDFAYPTTRFYDERAEGKRSRG
jgi:small-conductance mechanosensitive channel